MLGIISLWWLFVTVSLFGFFLAYLYGRETKDFKWSEYVAMIIIPVSFVVFLSFYYDRNIMKMFLYSAITGFLVEGVLGFVYHKVLNKRLWEYSKLSVLGYTSLLSIPLWGVGGVVFWFIGKFAGL